MNKHTSETIPSKFGAMTTDESSESLTMQTTLHEDSKNLENESPTRKISRPGFNTVNLSITIANTSTRFLKIHSSDVIQQPHSAGSLKKQKKFYQSKTLQLDYTTGYEHAEEFLDQHGFTIVEPGVATKVRKSVKVLPRSQSLNTDSGAGVTVYAGSPTLQKISDSSLLARRASGSKTASPVLKSPSTESENSMDHPPIVILTQKISRFAENALKNHEKEAVKDCDTQPSPDLNSRETEKSIEFVGFKESSHYNSKMFEIKQ